MKLNLKDYPGKEKDEEEERRITQERRETSRDESSNGYTQGSVGSARRGHVSQCEIHNNKKREGWGGTGKRKKPTTRRNENYEDEGA